MTKCNPLVFGLIFAVILSGCGYTTKTVLPYEMKTIYVKTTTNDIPIDRLYAYQPGVEIAITNGIINRVHRDGNLKIVDQESADVTLETVLIGYEQEGVRFSRLESVQEFRLYIVLRMRLIHNASGDVIWEEPRFTGDADYFVSDVKSIARDEANKRAIERLARNVVDRIVEDW